jgi:hypothetical protein
MTNYDIETISGDSYELDIIYRDSSRVPIDITNYTVYFQARMSRVSDDIVFDKTMTISAEDGILGKIGFILTPQETEILTLDNVSSKYSYSLRITSPDGFDVKTLLSGVVDVIKGVI